MRAARAVRAAVRDPGRAITPIGNDVESFWTSLTAGVSGVGRITAYDPSAEEVQIAAEVKGFEPKDWIDFKAARRMSRFSQLAVAAARQAIDASGLEISDANRDDIAVVVNTGGGGIGDVRQIRLDAGSGMMSAVPEPATWAMMLIGFGAVGHSMRKSRRRTGAGLAIA